MRSLVTLGREELYLVSGAGTLFPIALRATARSVTGVCCEELRVICNVAGVIDVEQC